MLQCNLYWDLLVGHDGHTGWSRKRGRNFGILLNFRLFGVENISALCAPVVSHSSYKIAYRSNVANLPVTIILLHWNFVILSGYISKVTFMIMIVKVFILWFVKGWLLARGSLTLTCVRILEFHVLYFETRSFRTVALITLVKYFFLLLGIKTFKTISNTSLLMNSINFSFIYPQQQSFA